MKCSDQNASPHVETECRKIIRFLKKHNFPVSFCAFEEECYYRSIDLKGTDCCCSHNSCKTCKNKQSQSYVIGNELEIQKSSPCKKKTKSCVSHSHSRSNCSHGSRKNVKNDKNSINGSSNGNGNSLCSSHRVSKRKKSCDDAEPCDPARYSKGYKRDSKNYNRDSFVDNRRNSNCGSFRKSEHRHRSTDGSLLNDKKRNFSRTNELPGNQNDSNENIYTSIERRRSSKNEDSESRRYSNCMDDEVPCKKKPCGSCATDIRSIINENDDIELIDGQKIIRKSKTSKSIKSIGNDSFTDMNAIRKIRNSNLNDVRKSIRNTLDLENNTDYETEVRKSRISSDGKRVSKKMDNEENNESTRNSKRSSKAVSPSGSKRNSKNNSYDGSKRNSRVNNDEDNEIEKIIRNSKIISVEVDNGSKRNSKTASPEGSKRNSKVNSPSGSKRNSKIINEDDERKLTEEDEEEEEEYEF